MTSKIFILVLIWAFVGLAYLVLAAAMPGINSIVSSVNATLVATSNMSNYPGAQQAITTSPIWIWVIPGGVGVISSVVVLKRESDGGMTRG
jgi:hypothetical protein